MLRLRFPVGVVLVVMVLGLAAGRAGAVPTIVVAPGASPAGGYLPLSSFGIAPIAGVGDDTVTDFNVPSFLYAGQAWSQLRVSSNGYLVVGPGSGAADNTFSNQLLPNPAAPNNLLAPFWTDLNPAAGGAIRIGTLTDGPDTWIVVDWAAVLEFSEPRTNSFEVWIGVNTDANPGEDITFAYGPIGGNGDSGLLTVGAEDVTGTVGDTYYYNGIGTLPTSGTQLRVTTRDLPVPGPGAIPEPLTAGLGATGLLALALTVRRRR